MLLQDSRNRRREKEKERPLTHEEQSWKTLGYGVDIFLKFNYSGLLLHCMCACNE